MRGYEVFARSRPLISSHLVPSHTISYHPISSQPNPSIHPCRRASGQTLSTTPSSTPLHPHLLTSKRRSPTYLPTHGRADRAQEFPNDDAVKPARARNEGCSRADEPRRRDPSHRIAAAESPGELEELEEKRELPTWAESGARAPRHRTGGL
jgi:hypothetical protein